MSDKKGVLATVLSVGTAAVGLAKEIANIWRSKEPEPVKADRHPLDALRDMVEGDRSKR